MRSLTVLKEEISFSLSKYKIMTHCTRGNEICNMYHRQRVSRMCKELPHFMGERQLTPTGKKWAKYIYKSAVPKGLKSSDVPEFTQPVNS